MSELPWRPVLTAPCPEVVLGPRRVDIRHRPLVAGTVSSAGGARAAVAEAQRLVAAGADLLRLASADGARPEHVAVLQAVRGAVDVPLCVAVSGGDEAGEVLASGAALVEDRGATGDPAVVHAVADAGGSLLVTVPPDLGEAVGEVLQTRAAQAEAAGLARARVVLDAGVEGHDAEGALALLHRHDRLAALGWPLAASAPPSSTAAGRLHPDDARTAALAALALAVSLGARVLWADDVRGARRTADVLAAILEARSA